MDKSVISLTWEQGGGDCPYESSRHLLHDGPATEVVLISQMGKQRHMARGHPVIPQRVLSAFCIPDVAL